MVLAWPPSSVHRICTAPATPTCNACHGVAQLHKPCHCDIQFLHGCPGARKAKDAEDEESMVVQLVWGDGHRQWLPTSKLQKYHHCCRSLVSFYESRARSRPVPKSNA